MADTTVAPNNKAVSFGGGKRMPAVSQNQNAAMHAAAEGKSNLGIPESVGKEFVAATPPGGVKDLPQRVGQADDPNDHETREARARADHLHKQGQISDEQHQHLHQQIPALAGARRPSLGGDPDKGTERAEGPQNKAEEDGETAAPKPRAP